MSENGSECKQAINTYTSHPPIHLIYFQKKTPTPDPWKVIPQLVFIREDDEFSFYVLYPAVHLLYIIYLDQHSYFGGP